MSTKKKPSRLRGPYRPRASCRHRRSREDIAAAKAEREARPKRPKGRPRKEPLAASPLPPDLAEIAEAEPELEISTQEGDP